jgi:hypothetical protein
VRDLRIRIAALESSHNPANCVTCEFRRMGDIGHCELVASCPEPRKRWEDHIMELDAIERAEKGVNGDERQ